jgi:formylglycine-generating enzyme required for sulfatase activity
MSSLADLPELIGFFSYSREDDEDSSGALSALRERIQRELRGQLGRSMKTFRLWQDKEAIASGALWEAEIKTATEQSVFFIPIITPTVVRSPYCRFELDSFLAREAALGRSDLVFPILYIKVPALDDSIQRENDPVLSIIAKRQYLDWREFRHRDVTSTDVKEAVERFCAHICDALHRRWLSPEERRKKEAEEARERAESERLSREAGARQRAEEALQKEEAEARGRAEEERRGQEAAEEERRAEDERLRKDAENKQHAEEEERRTLAELATRRRAEEEKAFATAKQSEPGQAWRTSKRALLIAGVLGVVLLGAVGVWFAGTQRTPVAPKITTVQPPLVPEEAPALRVQPSSSAFVPLSPEREQALKPKDSFKECATCPEMVVVPAGSFTMGSPENEPERQPDEGPQHAVTIARQFAVGRFAVTFDEWDACVADGSCNSYRPSDASWGRGRRPVINVSWDNAKAYIAWLSRKTGKPYRLLSEAEREYVARAGTTTAFWWGSSITPAGANYNGNVVYKGGGRLGVFPGRTVPVDSFQPNPWGLYNVHGNVLDWTEDCWNDSHQDNPGDGSARVTSWDCGRRVVRGGSWVNFPSELRSAMRISHTIDLQRAYLGFRVARTLAP